MILLNVVIMQVVCCDKQKKKRGTKKEAEKDEDSAVCTGCLYVWKDLLKINADTVVNSQIQSHGVISVFFLLTGH